jgi:hypothetical protein
MVYFKVSCYYATKRTDTLIMVLDPVFDRIYDNYEITVPL